MDMGMQSLAWAGELGTLLGLLVCSLVGGAVVLWNRRYHR